MATTEVVARQLLQEFDAFPRRRPPGVQVDFILSGQLPPENVANGLTADDLWLSQLYAGLAVLARDMQKYLDAHPGEASELFTSAVVHVHAEDAARYPEGQTFPNYEGLPTAGFPTGLAEAAGQGRPTITPLADPAIVHEWTTFPGFRLFRQFAREPGHALTSRYAATTGSFSSTVSGS